MSRAIRSVLNRVMVPVRGRVDGYRSLPREALGFTPRPMVRWFTPSELLRAGVKAGLSSLFGAYADRRELQALQPPRAGGPGDTLTAAGFHDFSQLPSLWLDYVADLGDGFDATYTVARLLAEPSLTLDGEETRRGDLLVMGGDQVYPTANREEYQNRLWGPFEAALPDDKSASPAARAASPRLFAIPGNHDWYDGLTSFIRLFCQGRRIGAWQTEQRRSYFAIKLPHDWWLWGLDIQLDADIDLPQQRFFWELASNPELMPRGSKVILCIAEPSWLYRRQQGEGHSHNLEHFEKRILHANGHEHVVGLAGDLHTYARYQEAAPANPARPKQRFVAGGGGAYLYPSHQLPGSLELPGLTQADGSRRLERYSLDPTGSGEPALFPEPAISRRLAWGVLLFPWHNKAFALLLGGLYLLLMWLAHAGSLASFGTGSSLISELARSWHPWEVLAVFWKAVRYNVPFLMLALACFGGLIAMADRRELIPRVKLGGIHAALHLFGAGLLLWLMAFGWGLVRELALAVGPLVVWHQLLGAAVINVIAMVAAAGAGALASAWLAARILREGGHWVARLALALIDSGLHVAVLAVLLAGMSTQGALAGSAAALVQAGLQRGGATLGLLAVLLLTVVAAAVLAAGVVMVAGVFAARTMAGYLLLANLFCRTDQGLRGVHANEVFSAQSIPHFKHFLRLRIDADGLTIYPVGIRQVCESWRFVENAPPGAARIEPAKGAISNLAELIEGPIRLK